MKLRRKDKKSSLFGVCLGALAVITAFRIGLGTLTDPGPGFLPFTGGLTMIFLSVIIYFQALSPGSEDGKELVQIGNRRILLLTISLILYALCLRKVGFVVANFFLLIFLLQLQERRSWLASAFISATTIVVSYLIFAVWLKISLPKGFYGF